MSFLIKYLLSAIPIYLVLACICVRWILDGMYRAATSAVASTVPALVPKTLANSSDIISTGVMSQYSSSISQYSGTVDSSALITILFIAPVGIFILAIAVGWTLRNAEMWTGPLITLGLSAVTAFILTNGMAGAAVSGEYITLFLKWIAFLVQPFAILATIIVLYITEKFRQSVSYTITSDGVAIRGGLWKRQEHLIPHCQIGRIVLEQDFLGIRYNYGTVIPQTLTRWGAETSIRGVGAGGQKGNIGVGVGFAKGREEASRYPLDCLFGIPDPGKAQHLLESFICRPQEREEEQLAYLKKIYESKGKI
jgi:membrane protein YdbS with pleckstrin-like domain